MERSFKNDLKALILGGFSKTTLANALGYSRRQISRHLDDERQDAAAPDAVRMTAAALADRLESHGYDAAALFGLELALNEIARAEKQPATAKTGAAKAGRVAAAGSKPKARRDALPSIAESQAGENGGSVPADAAPHESWASKIRYGALYEILDTRDIDADAVIDSDPLAGRRLIDIAREAIDRGSPLFGHVDYPSLVLVPHPGLVVIGLKRVALPSLDSLARCLVESIAGDVATAFARDGVPYAMQTMQDIHLLRLTQTPAPSLALTGVEISLLTRRHCALMLNQTLSEAGAVRMDELFEAAYRLTLQSEPRGSET